MFVEDSELSPDAVIDVCRICLISGTAAKAVSHASAQWWSLILWQQQHTVVAEL